MSQTIAIEIGEIRCRAELSDSPCARAVAAALPIAARAGTWGEEIYFDIPVSFATADDARTRMAVGELGYWPPGKAFCIFFGPTPVSGADGVPVAASEVNPIGRLLDDPAPLRTVPDGAEVRLVKAAD